VACRMFLTSKHCCDPVKSNKVCDNGPSVLRILWGVHCYSGLEIASSSQLRKLPEIHVFGCPAIEFHPRLSSHEANGRPSCEINFAIIK
jgi:hypothetical protein